MSGIFRMELVALAIILITGLNMLDILMKGKIRKLITVKGLLAVNIVCGVYLLFYLAHYKALI